MAATLTVDPNKLAQLTPEQRAGALQTVKEGLWRYGNLSFKRHVTQRKISAAIDAAFAGGAQQFYYLCSRRIGKSFDLVLRAFEACLKQRGARVLYLAPQAKDAADIVNDLVSQILDDCPPDIKPTYNGQDKTFYFPSTLSMLRLKATNGEHAKYLRGGYADLIILDECGMMDDLNHVLNDVCMPMTMVTPSKVEGKILLATTPPRSPGHESAKIYEDLASKGCAIKFTIRDMPHVTDDKKAKYLVAAGEREDRAARILLPNGNPEQLEPESTTAKREYFCEFVTDSDSAVVPAYTPTSRKEILSVHPRPQCFDAYTVMDPGYKDRTGILFGYWDYVKERLIIEDELLLQHADTLDIATGIQNKERELWGHQIPYARISDIELRLIADLRQYHKLDFRKAQKQDSQAGINLLNLWVQQRKIIIHPRCTNLDRQLLNAVWNTRGTDFDRPDDPRNEMGHYDLVAALKYFVRGVNPHHNPYPDNWFIVGGPGGLPSGTWISPKRGAKKKSGLNLLPDTPLGRKLSKTKPKR